MTPYPSATAGPSNVNRKKEEVKFSTLAHPPKANLLPPAALLSLLCLAFLCLLFVCFRHTECIIQVRKKVTRWIQVQVDKLNTWLNQRIKGNRNSKRTHGPITLGEDDAEGGQDSINATSHHLVQTISLNSSHHPNLQPLSSPQLFIDDDDDDDDEVIP